MNVNSQIFCVEHCNNKSIFCRIIPECCPLCGATLDPYTTHSFLLPYCCTNAINNPPAIVLKPTNGTFRDDYNITNDMHIGIVTSDSHIYEYDHRGITSDQFDKWNDCVTINIVPQSWYSHWDEVLSKLLNDPKWIGENYHPHNFNCYNLIIEFLQNLNYNELNFVDKEQICQQLLLPKLRYTFKYAYLYRMLNNRPYYIL